MSIAFFHIDGAEHLFPFSSSLPIVFLSAGPDTLPFGSTASVFHSFQQRRERLCNPRGPELVDVFVWSSVPSFNNHLSAGSSETEGSEEKEVLGYQEKEQGKEKESED